VIRGSDGECLGGFAKNISMCSAYAAELWGVLKGLVYARRLDFKVIELHVHSEMVANVLTSNHKWSPFGRTLVVKIRHLLELEWDVVVHHSYREVNNVLTL